MANEEKPRALVLPRNEVLDRAEEALYEAGLLGGEHYETDAISVGRMILPMIRSIDDDREVLGDIAKQLVIAGIPFRLVTVGAA